MNQSKLTTEEWILKNWLEENHISGKFWSIEELVENVRDKNGFHIFRLNTDPFCHDKCIKLSKMIRTINWNCNEGYKIIIKDSKGGAKLCKSEEEFEEWRAKELKPIERKCKYLNNLVWKAKRDGTMPVLNQALNEVKDLKPIEVYKK